MAWFEFYKFPLQCEVKETNIGIGFSELENELGGGFYSQMLYGSENGERFWKLTLPTLSDGTAKATYTSINGETGLTPQEVLWDLYCEQKVSGVPFMYQCPRSRRYYLVRFADSNLTYERLLIALYSTGLTIKQWRIKGKSCFYPAEISGIYAWYAPGYWQTSMWHSGTDGYPPLMSPQDKTLLTSGSVSSTGALNGYDAVQFSFGADNGVANSTPYAPAHIKEIFMVMRMREATFSNYGGVLTGPDSDFDPPLIGDNGTTKFFDFGLYDYQQEYFLNGIKYANNDMQAPMNEWGIVHLRHLDSGWYFKEVQMGKDRDKSGRFARMDVAEVILSETLQPKNVTREIYEHFQMQYNLVLT